jgi:hypothetical protein
METMRKSLHAAHDLAGAIWYGGNVFGILALNPAVSEASLKSDRGAVTNQAWENFIPYGLGSALTFGATYALIRLDEPRLGLPELRALTTIRDISAASIVALTLVGGVLNRITAETSPGDRTPMEDGLTPAEEAPEPAKQGLLGLRLVAAGNLVAGTTYFLVTALQEQSLMDQRPLSRALLPLQRAGRAGGIALEAAKGLAAAELLRRGARMVTDGIGVTKPAPEPQPRSRFQQIGDRFGSLAELAR